MTGEITAEEYRDILIPAIDAATADGARVKMLAALPEGISGFSAGAALEDARMGLKHWSGFDRVAVLADAGALTGALHFFSVLMPCPVKPFPVDQADDARRWLEESLGAIHQTDLGEGVLHVQFVGQLDRAAYEGEGGDIDQFIRKNSRFRLIVDLREFDGWQGIGGLTEHIKTLKGRAALVERVAIVAGADWHKMVAGVGRHMLKAEVEVFENFDAAKDWVSS
ncbi:MAG: STAS/SEC14 domain-containing protein [Rhodobacteraceae bacterium]|nr:STAS/SEC14 domain-containing protein [Paracoccaceae bacterium]